jgi:hypothetical protein
LAGTAFIVHPTFDNSIWKAACTALAHEFCNCPKAKCTGVPFDYSCGGDPLCFRTASQNAAGPATSLTKSCGPELRPQPITAQRAARKADRISFTKMGIVLKELNETVIWLEVIAKAQFFPKAEIVAVISENRELCRILTAAVKTARAATNS